MVDNLNSTRVSGWSEESQGKDHLHFCRSVRLRERERQQRWWREKQRTCTAGDSNLSRDHEETPYGILWFVSPFCGFLFLHRDLWRGYSYAYTEGEEISFNWQETEDENDERSNAIKRRDSVAEIAQWESFDTRRNASKRGTGYSEDHSL